MVFGNQSERRSSPGSDGRFYLRSQPLAAADIRRKVAPYRVVKLVPPKKRAEALWRYISPAERKL